MFFKVSGDKAIINQLKSLEKKLATKISRKGLRASAKVFKKYVQAETPVDTGLTLSAIKVKAGKRKKDVVRMTVQIGAGDYQGETYYASFLNFGYLNDDGSWAIEPMHFVNKGFDKGKEEAKKAGIEVMLREIEAEANR